MRGFFITGNASMSKPPPIDLPEKYYLGYFESILTFVSEQYDSLLQEQEHNFLHRFAQLSENARCLYIRIFNRRGRFFRVNRLKYPEIEPLQDSVDELISEQFIVQLPGYIPEQSAELLHIFTKAELTRLGKTLLEYPGKLGALKKGELISLLSNELDSTQLVNAVAGKEPIITINFEAEVTFLHFLFFGNLHENITSFVVRDIGYIKTELFDQKKLKPQFTSRKEAEDKLFVIAWYENFKLLRDEIEKETVPPEEAYHYFRKQVRQRNDLCKVALPQYDKMVQRCGKLLEQYALYAEAFQVYQHSPKAPSRERRARLLYRLNHNDEALNLCAEMIENPQNAEERYFARDFSARLTSGKRLKSTTQLLKRSDTIVLPTSKEKVWVEMEALTYYQNQGFNGTYSENYLWRGLFGLVFWDIIYNLDSDALHNPLQRAPSDLYSPNFYTKREPMIRERLDVIECPKDFEDLLDRHFSNKFGIYNPFVGWHENLLPLVKRVYNLLGAPATRKVLNEMARDLRENTRGFPDLFIWNEKTADYSFIEIKSPNDHLSAQQLYWIEFFSENDINAKVVRIAWNN